MRPTIFALFGALAFTGCGAVAPNSAPEADAQTQSATQLSTTSNHVCFIDAVGVLRCFGDDGVGQLGRGTEGGRSDAAVVVRPDMRWLRVSAGIVATCAIAVDRSLWCWGGKAAMAVLDLGTDNRTSPTRVGTASDWDQIAVGWNAVCGSHTGGKLDCFLARGRETVEGGPGFREVSASFYSVVALDALGQTYLVDLDAPSPSIAYAPDAPRFVHVHQPVFGVFGLDAQGHVARWTRALGVELSQDGTKFVDVHGAYDVVAVAADGAIWLHSDQHSAIPSPLHLRRLDAVGTGWSAVRENAAGEVCGVRREGRVACFRVTSVGDVGPVRDVP